MKIALSVRSRIFGGFAVVLVLLAALALVAHRGMVSVRVGAARVSDDSSEAMVSTDVALQVSDAHARVVQYVLSASLDDQKAAQASLARLDQSLGRARTAGGGQDQDLQGLATRYRGAVDATISAVEARRDSVERLQSSALEARTIIAAMVEQSDREDDPAALRAVAHVAQIFGASDSAASQFVAARTPAEANAASSTLQSLRDSVASLATLVVDNRRMQRLIKGLTDPLERFAAAVQKVVAADARLSDAASAREVAATAVLRGAAEQRARATDSQRRAIESMEDSVELGQPARPGDIGERDCHRCAARPADRTWHRAPDTQPDADDARIGGWPARHRYTTHGPARRTWRDGTRCWRVSRAHRRKRRILRGNKR